MRKTLQQLTAVLLLLVMTAAGAHAQDADHLLLTEIVVTPTAGEMVEIYNPTSASVDLTDYYLTDATFARDGVFYYNIVTGSNSGGGGFADWHARFPSGATISPGEFQTISMAGSDDFESTYGVSPTYELYEDNASADAIPDMLEVTSGSINGQGGLSNGGEMVVLYTWDGASDIVQDVDYVVWGDKNEAVSKDGVSTDGPDLDSTPTPYNSEVSTGNQDVIAADGHSDGNSFQREDFTEGAETQSGGNGLTGNDEMSEDFSNTWVQAGVTPNVDLPVELASFDGDFTGSGIALTWKTLTETNNAGFDLQHRAPGEQTFRTASFIEGAGTTNQVQTYRFLLSTTAEGTHTFRLRQVDVDGAENFSKPIEVLVGRSPVVLSGPNPVKAGASLDLAVRSERTQSVDIALYNVLGQKVASIYNGSISSTESLQTQVKTTGLSNGVYFVRVLGESFQTTRKLTVVR